MKQLFSPSRIFPTVFGGVGLILFVIAGVIAFFTVRSAQEAETRIDQIRKESATVLEGNTVGREVVIEGQISSRMRPTKGPWVAYLEVFTVRGNDDDSTYEQYGEDIRPPLLLDVPDGEIEVRDYAFATESLPLAASSDGVFYSLAVGQRVVVSGMSVHNSEQPTIEHAIILNPPTDTYFNRLRSEANAGWVGVVIVGLLGTVFTAFGVLFYFAFVRNDPFGNMP